MCPAAVGRGAKRPSDDVCPAGPFRERGSQHIFTPPVGFPPFDSDPWRRPKRRRCWHSRIRHRPPGARGHIEIDQISAKVSLTRIRSRRALESPIGTGHSALHTHCPDDSDRLHIAHMTGENYTKFISMATAYLSVLCDATHRGEIQLQADRDQIPASRPFLLAGCSTPPRASRLLALAAVDAARARAIVVEGLFAHRSL